MNRFPIEVLVNIFGYLDDNSLLNSEKVCTKWKSAIEDEFFYAKKCLEILKRQKNLQSTFDKHKFMSVIRNDQKEAKMFYYKLRNLTSQWKIGKPRIYQKFCKNRDVSEEWSRHHNYTGVYDMVWIPEKSYLICSCYDTIQVGTFLNKTYNLSMSKGM